MQLHLRVTLGNSCMDVLEGLPNCIDERRGVDRRTPSGQILPSIPQGADIGTPHLHNDRRPKRSERSDRPAQLRLRSESSTFGIKWRLQKSRETTNKPRMR